MINFERLLLLPDHLRKTAFALERHGLSSASDISKDTGRSRSLESLYLNTLVLCGYASRTTGKLKARCMGSPQVLFFPKVEE
jgi:hypothetical protein